MARIARALNEAGVPCPSAADPGRNAHRTGNGWTLGTVTTILENPRYTGRQVWNRQRITRRPPASITRVPSPARPITSVSLPTAANLSPRTAIASATALPPSCSLVTLALRTIRSARSGACRSIAAI